MFTLQWMHILCSVTYSTTIQYCATVLTVVLETLTFSQRIFRLDSMARPHECNFLDEAGFNLMKRRQGGRNIIGQRAIIEVPGQCGENITLCAAMSSEGLVHRHAVLSSFNAQRLLTFVVELRDTSWTASNRILGLQIISFM